MDDNIAIKVEHISKTFHEQAGARSLKEAFVNIGRKLTGKKENKIHKGNFTALKDINFEVKKGEFFGIVGRNGCGKSTLLKIIAGVYTPTKGAVMLNGKLTPFIELGVGFNPELSGRDNVFLNGALLGFSRKQMEEMYDDIVEFAELKDFMDVKLKNYSSGMQVRLAFSVAIRAESDILLIDEVLAVGDAAFQQKCFEYFEKLKKDKKTVIFITHDMTSFRQYCDRGMYIDRGQISKISNVTEISKLYDKSNYSGINNKTPRINNRLAVKILNTNDELIKNVASGSKFKIYVNWSTIKDNVNIVGVIISKEGQTIFATNSTNQLDYSSKKEAYLEIEQFLGNGRYTITVGLFAGSRHNCIEMIPDILSFNIYGNKVIGKHSDEWFGVVYLENMWR